MDTAKLRHAKVQAERFYLREISGARLFCSSQISVLCEPLTFLNARLRRISHCRLRMSSSPSAHGFKVIASLNICSQPIVANAVRNELSILAPVSSAVAAEVMARAPLFFLCPQVVAAVVAKLAPLFDTTQIKEHQNCLSEHWGKTVFTKGSFDRRSPTRCRAANPSFDARGMPSSSITLICEGRLDAIYASLEESERYRIAPTGHAKIGRAASGGKFVGDARSPLEKHDSC